MNRFLIVAVVALGGCTPAVSQTVASQPRTAITVPASPNRPAHNVFIYGAPQSSDARPSCVHVRGYGNARGFSSCSYR